MRLCQFDISGAILLLSVGMVVAEPVVIDAVRVDLDIVSNVVFQQSDEVVVTARLTDASWRSLADLHKRHAHSKIAVSIGGHISNTAKVTEAGAIQFAFGELHELRNALENGGHIEIAAISDR